MVREGSFPFCCLSLFVAYPFLLLISFCCLSLFVAYPFLLALQIDITAVYMYLVF